MKQKMKKLDNNTQEASHIPDEDQFDQKKKRLMMYGRRSKTYFILKAPPADEIAAAGSMYD